MQFLQKKLMHLIPVVIAVSVVTFLFVNLLPGNVAYNLLGDQATPELVAEVEKELGLDKPLVLRYVIWFGGVLKGDFGRSFVTREDVMSAIMDRMPISIELMVITQVFALLLSMPLGILSAYRAGRPLDRMIAGTSFGLLSIPNFMMAIILIFIFSVKLDWFPATGFTPLTEDLTENLQSFFLPALTLAMIEMCALMRVLRSDMIATLQEEFIMVARAKGLPNWRILLTHALKPSLFSMITLFAINMASLISGSLVVETIFALPGLGSLLVQSIYTRDYIMVQGVVLFGALAFVIINFAVDMVYAVLDPRIRHDNA